LRQTQFGPVPAGLTPAANKFARDHPRGGTTFTLSFMPNFLNEAD